MSFKVQLQAKLRDGAIDMAIKGKFLEATKMFDQSGTLPEEQAKHTEKLAYAFYRRALFVQSNQDENQAINDLETANKFPGVSLQLRSLIQQRLTIIRKESIPETRKLDEAIEWRFERPLHEVELLNEFFQRFGLSSATRLRDVDGIDEISSVGVYRWSGDINRNEQWSKLIRQFKNGDSVLAAFFGHILAEHIWRTQKCWIWTQEIDFIIPIPAAVNRTAERGVDIVGKVGNILSSRLKIPIRTDFLKRHQNPERSRFVSRTDLKLQYSFRRKKALEIQERTVLLLDDVMNRGYTVGVCASLLKEYGCSKVVLLVLALSESTFQSGRHIQGEYD